MNDAQTVNLAIGRIFKMASRPSEAGDVAEYERCRRLILDLLQPVHEWMPPAVTASHDYARDRLRGAQGDAP